MQHDTMFPGMGPDLLGTVLLPGDTGSMLYGNCYVTRAYAFGFLNSFIRLFTNPESLYFTVGVFLELL
jgi:hypothetical protein